MKNTFLFDFVQQDESTYSIKIIRRQTRKIALSILSSKLFGSGPDRARDIGQVNPITTFPVLTATTPP